MGENRRGLSFFHGPKKVHEPLKKALKPPMEGGTGRVPSLKMIEWEKQAEENVKEMSQPKHMVASSDRGDQELLYPKPSGYAMGRREK